jgi:prephenate dehydrogenase
MFRQQTFALCRTQRTDPAAERLVQSLVTTLEAVPLWVDAAEHDQAVALLSHLPYMLATSLVQSSDQLPTESMRLAASGYRDTSRLAASDPRMMCDVLLTNREAILEALGAVRSRLDELADLLQASAGERLRAIGAAAQQRRQQSLSQAAAATECSHTAPQQHPDDAPQQHPDDSDRTHRT